ncbi:MAG: hypothetical protein ISS11_08050 [Candidatus Marinimicrobia bacterium]|nr:hypothetical protein [Candidatus Neomarinimicrobiota bacterium]
MIVYIFIGFLAVVSFIRAAAQLGDGAIFSALFWISICFLIVVKKIDGVKSLIESRDNNNSN